MISIDCPICSGEAHIEGQLDAITCEGCGVTVDVAADATDALEIAA
jgi:hypothetical protein